MPLYAAPERLHGAPASAGSDWYAFGVVLLEALTGVVPPDLLASALRGEPPTLPALPATFPRAALLRGLLEPESRLALRSTRGVRCAGGRPRQRRDPPGCSGAATRSSGCVQRSWSPGCRPSSGRRGRGSEASWCVVGTLGGAAGAALQVPPHARTCRSTPSTGSRADLLGHSGAAPADPPGPPPSSRLQVVEHLRRLPAPGDLDRRRAVGRRRRRPRPRRPALTHGGVADGRGDGPAGR